MTPQERAVINAAREMFNAIDQEPSNPAYHRIYPVWGHLGDALSALSTPPAEAEGEMVEDERELELTVWRAGLEIDFTFAEIGKTAPWRRLGTVRLPLIPANMEKPE